MGEKRRRKHSSKKVSDIWKHDTLLQENDSLDDISKRKEKLKRKKKTKSIAVEADYAHHTKFKFETINKSGNLKWESKMSEVFPEIDEFHPRFKLSAQPKKR